MTLKPLEFEIKTGDRLEISLPRILQELIELEEGDKILLSIETLKSREKNKLDTLGKSAEITYTDTSENELALFNNAMNDPVYKKIITGIQNISKNIEMRRPQKTMVGFYEKGYGLVWVAYHVAGKIRIHLRKINYSEVEIPREKFVDSGWGGYPEFHVNSENDIEYVFRLVKYALNLLKED